MNKYYFEGDIVAGFNNGITTETPIEFGCSRFEQIQYYIDEQNLPTLEKALMSDKEKLQSYGINMDNVAVEDIEKITSYFIFPEEDKAKIIALCNHYEFGMKIYQCVLRIGKCCFGLPADPHV